jgi:outer membrane protein TolC
MLSYSLAALLLAAGPAHPARGEEGELLRISLAEAVERARAASAGLARLRALEQAAAADARGARAGRLPQIGLSAGYTRASDVPELILALPGQPARPIFPNLPDNYRARLELSLPLYMGGRVQGQVAAARHENAAATSDLRAGDADLVLEVKGAYWSLVTAEASARVLGESLAAFDAHLKDALNRERFGMAARNEVLAVQVERDRAELARLRAQNGAALAQAELTRLLDLPAATRVAAAEPLEGAAAPLPESSALLASALASRPERAALASRLAAAEARVAVERSARLPQATAAAGYDYANPNRKILPPSAEWNHTWDVSLSLSLSVFDGGRAGASVARARARAEAARQALADLDRRVRLQVTRALLDLQTAAAAVMVAERSLEAAGENRRVASDRYREGVIPSSELLDAEIALQRAGLDRTEALAQARLAEAALARAAGR